MLVLGVHVVERHAAARTLVARLIENLAPVKIPLMPDFALPSPAAARLCSGVSSLSLRGFERRLAHFYTLSQDVSGAKEVCRAIRVYPAATVGSMSHQSCAYTIRALEIVSGV